MDALTLKRRATLGAAQVESMLVVSTAHMTEEEGRAVTSGDHWAKPTFARDEGFMFHRDSLSQEGDSITLSAGFFGCIKRAHDLGCDWIMFDCDGDVIEDIPSYEW